MLSKIYEKWNVKNNLDGNGYEDVYHLLNPMKREEFRALHDNEKEKVINDIFEIYRGRNIFPITYFNYDNCIKEVIKCVEKDVEFKNGTIDLPYTQGANLCRFLFPNLMRVECKGVKNNSPYDKFVDDYKLKRAISFALTYKSGVICSPSNIRGGLEMIGGNVATNFKPMVAKALYEKYTPKNGVIYDFACGFGGRLLGALSSKNNYKYMGVEPCTETFESLNILGKLIENATNRNNIFRLYQIGSEDFKGWRETIDFSFSSPPYFTLERYSEEETQCYNKFKELDEWIEGYIRPTIKNIYQMLKHDRYYAVNIADFKIGNKEFAYVDEWIRISQEEGFQFHEQLAMTLQTRRGEGHSETNGRTKKEGVFVFYKK